MPKFNLTPEQAREKWIEDLESGKHQQLQGNLAFEDTRTGEKSFCCLGRACEVFMEYEPDLLKKCASQLKNDKGWYTPDGAVFYYYYDKVNDIYNDDVLPPVVRDWLGLESDDGRFYIEASKSEAQTLATLNDGGSTFPQIAEVIRSNPPGLLE